MAKKLTVGQKRAERLKEQAATPLQKKKGGDRIDDVIARIKKLSQHGGRVMRGSEVAQQTYRRRKTPFASFNWVLGGGLPKPGLVEIGGEYSCGKTTLTLQICAHVQRTEREEAPTFGAVFWAALEPFSKTWARENGFFLPFSEELVFDEATQEWVPADPFANATETELFKMEEAGITDPYAEITPFVLYQDPRGDVTLDAARTAMMSNQFSLVVVDSLGAAKSSKWLYEQDVQDAGDFDRTAKMIGDYTARVMLACNARYDENNMLAEDGINAAQTTVINLAQIVTVIGTQAHSPWKKYAMKGGEGAKHNHHAVVFVWKGEQLRAELPGGRQLVYGQDMKFITIKSKIGVPFRQGELRFQFEDYGEFRKGTVDRARDLLAMALVAGTVQSRGSHYYVGEDSLGNGRDAAAAFLRENPEWYEYVFNITSEALK